MARLERHVTWLRDQLERTKQEAAQQRGRVRPAAVAIVALLSAALGAGATLAVRMPHLSSAPPVVLVAPGTGPLTTPHAQFKGSGNPSAAASTEATALYQRALDRLTDKDFGGAEAQLEACIAEGDLPECHRLLGTILALEHDPAARTHLEQYLHIAPAAPDADAIRRLLETQ